MMKWCLVTVAIASSSWKYVMVLEDALKGIKTKLNLLVASFIGKRRSGGVKREGIDSDSMCDLSQWVNVRAHKVELQTMSELSD